MEERTPTAAEWLQGLYGTYYDRLRTMAQARLLGVGLADMADDVVQETMKQAFEEMKSLIDHPNIGGWLYKNTFYRCNNLIRTASKQMKRTEFSMNEPDAPEIPDRRAEEEMMECLNTKRSYQEAIDYLEKNASENDYRLFEQVYLKKESISKLSQQYETSDAAMRMRICRMKEKMLKLMTTFLKLFVL